MRLFGAAATHHDAAPLSVTPERGAVLHGPPGTGKTLLAGALAREIAAILTITSASKIFGPLVGMSEKAVDGLFMELLELQREHNRLVLCVIDEIDSLLPSRERLGSMNSVDGKVVNMFLQWMDGAKRREHQEGLARVILVGTTNFLASLDAAATRSGRFSTHIEIGLPTSDERVDIILKLAAARIRASNAAKTKQGMAADSSLFGESIEDLARRVADGTEGLVGADLNAILEHACRRALRERISNPAAPLVVTPDLISAAMDFVKTRKSAATNQKPQVSAPKIGFGR